jgi:hypothetical protein
MVDGAVEEDVFDPAMAASLKRAVRSGVPQISFVNEPVDVTGSTPEPEPTGEH